MNCNDKSCVPYPLFCIIQCISIFAAIRLAELLKMALSIFQYFSNTDVQVGCTEVLLYYEGSLPCDVLNIFFSQFSIAKNSQFTLVQITNMLFH